MFPLTLSIPIQDPSQVGEARRAVVDSAFRLGMKEETIGKLALITTELSTNLIKHGRGGEILFGRLNGTSNDLEIMALDKGPGVSDWKRAFGDGFSTAGTPGNGLGSIARLSSEYFFYSVPERGTIVTARLTGPHTSAEEDRFEVGAICRPIHGEQECGDSWAVLRSRNGVRAIVADGLGHGVLAAEASQAAIRIARENPDLAPTALIERAHEALRATRGAALAVADIDLQSGIIRYSGIGNISAVIAAQGSLRHMMSHNGTAGLQIRHVQEFTYPWTSSSLLLMHSDGLSTRWSLDSYPGIAARHASIIGGALYRDFSRERDDVTVLTLREKDGGR